MTRQRHVVFADRFHRLDWQLPVNRIVTAKARYNRAPTYVDSIGAREPLFGRTGFNFKRHRARPEASLSFHEERVGLATAAWKTFAADSRGSRTVAGVAAGAVF